MNTIDNDENTRPIGYWLNAADRLMAAEFAAAFESEGVTRREWRLLNLIDGTAPAGVRPNRPLPEHKLGRLIQLGWVTRTDSSWSLTDEGRTAKERLGAIVESIRAKVADAVPEEDLATTVSALEQLARAFGWDEETPLPRGRGGRGHGRGRDGRGHSGRGARHGGFGRTMGFGPADAFDAQDGRGSGRGRGGHHGFRSPEGFERAGSDHCGHGHHAAHLTQTAYERGFDAGYTRGNAG